MNEKNKEHITIVGLSIVSALITYTLNVIVGYGPFIANGFVGILAALLLPKGLTAATYTASFVGMSDDFVIPSLTIAALAGLIVGIMIIITKPILAGWGGKGGTTAALSVVLTLAVINIFSL
ncbi:hypothetical protein [Natranaerobius trueperi]|uniref:ECF transporter S component n=1 Tax=Natranaerobius trueperi TaxID=759412 RepID=A0A226BWH8_9FIRM|nr:hypothetical protein [Natranaerobius trueperi]OWZ83271.1 hypothetical protein CDO51_09435 [Natranaerobius trueperi]